MPTPEERARETIDALLEQAGWAVQDRAEVNLDAGRGVVVRNVPLESGYGSADYLLYVVVTMGIYLYPIALTPDPVEMTVGSHTTAATPVLISH